MIDWIITHRKALLSYSLMAFALVFATYSISNKFQTRPEKDYLEAESYFSKWSNGQTNEKELLQKLEKVMGKHPELHARYDALIAEKLLLWNEIKEAEKYLSPVLTRVASDSAYYPQFSKTTFLIFQGDLKQALEDARDLREEMKGDDSLFSSNSVRWEGVLHAFNLMRIATLEKQVGTPEGEQAAWDEIIALRDKDPEAFSMIHYHFKENNLTLFDYIQHRKEQLNSVSVLD